MELHPVTFLQAALVLVGIAVTRPWCPTDLRLGALDLTGIYKFPQTELTFILLPAVVGRPFLSACRFSGNKDFIKGLAEEKEKGLVMCKYLGGGKAASLENGRGAVGNT